MEMEKYGQNAEKLKKSSQEKIQSAKEIGQEIQNLKDTLSDMPEGLDADIEQGIELTIESGRDAAREVVTEVRSEADGDQSEADKVNEGVDSKISDNNAAHSKLESVSDSRFGGKAGDAMAKIQENNAMGDTIKTQLSEDMQTMFGELQNVEDSI